MTSVCCKTMKRIVVSHVIWRIIDCFPIISMVLDVADLLKIIFYLTYGEIATWVDSGMTVDVALLDFSKASDVNHNVLLNKLGNNGIVDPLLSWIRCFLMKRNESLYWRHLSSERRVLRIQFLRHFISGICG